MTPAGGLRARLLFDSVHAHVRACLDAGGWLDPSRGRKDIHLIDEPKEWDEPIELNSVALSVDTSDDIDAELGSNATIDTHTFYFDVYAQNDIVGRAIAHEIKDILRGKRPSIGADRPVVPLIDFTLATPAPFAYADVSGVVVDQVRNAPKPWQRYWFTVRFDVEDDYYDEDDD